MRNNPNPMKNPTVMLRKKQHNPEISIIGNLFILKSLKAILPIKNAVYIIIAPNIASGNSVKIKKSVSEKKIPRNISIIPSKIIDQLE